MTLSLHHAAYQRGGRLLLREASVDVRPGSLLAILGPNGAGKSTLLGLLSGRLTATQGRATLDDRRLDDWCPVELSRRRAILSQRVQLGFGFKVWEVVRLGIARPRGGERHDEARLVAEVLGAVGARHLAERSYLQLSGGEQQRVQLARVLAQIWLPRAAPSYLLLGEPEAGLDIAHQHLILGLARQRAECGSGVAVVLHDLNLAARYADRAVLVHDGRVAASGAVDEVLTAERLGAVFGVPLRRITLGQGEDKRTFLLH